MAWMKSVSSGNWYLTNGFTQRKITDATEASQVTEVLGFQSATASSQAILAEIARVEQDRAALVKEIADAVLAGVAAGVTVTADIDGDAIAAKVEARLADEFAAVNANIDNQPTQFKVTPA